MEMIGGDGGESSLLFAAKLLSMQSRSIVVGCGKWAADMPLVLFVLLA